MTKESLWWQHSVIYQICPSSFMDSNGDGMGDMPGVISKLDYLQWLGIKAIWFTPIYPSPMRDFGYDVSDYNNINPRFGNMADFEKLIAEAHKRDMKVLIDFVPNHTSDRHPWFIESRKSRDNPKRDWYLWHDPAPDGGPPNNWISVFEGSAWEYDKKTRQYYYHTFMKQQPELNWRNPKVKRAIFAIMRFWLKKGVDGFRMDVLSNLIKDVYLRDNPPNPEYDPHKHISFVSLLQTYSCDQPEVHPIITEMCKLTNRYRNRLLIGEIHLPLHDLVAYYGQHKPSLHIPFNFYLVLNEWNARNIFEFIKNYENALPPHGWPNWLLDSHDSFRIMSRVGRDQARVAAMLLLTLRGTPFIYYGEEIGMQYVALSREDVIHPKVKELTPLTLEYLPVRTPMQWDDSPAAGFTTGKPWLPVAPNFQLNNVAVQQDDPDSMLSLYRKLIHLRNKEPALQTGDYVPVEVYKDIIVFIRQSRKRRFLIVLNLGHRARVYTPESLPKVRGKVVVCTNRERENTVIKESIEIDGSEGLIIQLD